MRIVFLGAGSVGCFVGGCWQACGLDVGFVGRKAIADEIAAHGLTLTDHTGWRRALPAETVGYGDEPAALAGADLVVVTVKSTATIEAAGLIADHARPDATVLSLQNGISNVDILRERLAGHEVIAGMVGFNVARLSPGHWHMGTGGEFIAARAPITEKIATASAGTPAALTVSDDIKAVAWGKLLLNLNNAVNALSGLKLVDELSTRGYRRVLAASIAEALAVLNAAGIAPAKLTALPPSLLSPFLNTPDWFFRAIGLRLQKIDANARSSMADDFAAGRLTEIDFLNGEIVRLAGRVGVPAPVNARVVELVKAAQTGGRREWSAKDLVAELGLG
ncbi:MAG: 2-dehydropantoate 2-reductase [Rhizobiaceae bacterium]